jgi:hypothetical protein
MSASVAALLRADGAAPSDLRILCLAGLSSAAFGAAIGAYTGGRQILYAAVKMPLYLLCTLAISFAAMHLFAARRLRLRDTLAVATEAGSLTALVLGALAPVVFLLAAAWPRSSYTGLVLVLVAAVAAGGVAGVARLHARLRQPGLTAAWVLLYQFVGAQMGWLLKPWVGHTATDDRFLPLRENLQGNFYESVFGILSSFFR